MLPAPLKLLNLSPMNEKKQKLIGTREKDDALLNFVVRQAQEAILNPNVPESDKDAALETAISTIQKVAEGKATYYAKHGDGRRTRKQRVIYEASNYEDEERENIPPIIAALNENLKRHVSEDTNGFTVEWIAERTGINKKTLYEWTESDTELTTALERLKEAQNNDPFKTGTEEDTFVNSMMVALLLLETKDRHLKKHNGQTATLRKCGEK
jgi:hypothetical protein